MSSWPCSAWSRARLSQDSEADGLWTQGWGGAWSQLRVRRNFLFNPLFFKLYLKHLLLLSLIYLLIVLMISNML